MASDGYFDNSDTVRAGSSSSYKSEYALWATVVAAMAVSVAASTYTCTVDTSAQSEQDVSRITSTLSRLNFDWSLSGSTLTISW